MSFWPRVPLNETAVERGLVGGPFGSSLVGKDYVESGVPVIRGTNLNYGRELGGDYAFVSEAKVSKDLARNVAEPGDLVFTQRGTLGQVALVPFGGYAKYVVSQSQMRLRVDPAAASPVYLYYACSSGDFFKQISDNAIATGVPHINLGILSRLEVHLPSLNEQQGIADVLGALDNKIAANAKLIASATDTSTLLLAKELPTFPLSTLVTHRTKTVSPTLFVGGEVLHYSLPAFDTGQCPESTHPEAIKSSKFLVERSCVLVSKLNPRFPRIWDIPCAGDQTSLASTEFLVLESKYSTSSVLWAILSQSSFGIALEAKAAGTSGSHQRVRPADLLATEVIDPRGLSATLHYQLKSLGQTRNRYREESAVLEATRDVLLPQLMSGNLRVKDAEKKAEEVL